MVAALPVVHRAAVSAYLVLCGPFLGLAGIWIASWLRSGRLMLAPILLCLAIAAAWALWLARFRLELRADSFAYRAPGRARSVAYAQVLDYAATFDESPQRLVLRLADGTVLPINLKVMSRPVGRALLARMPHVAPAS